MAIGIWSSQVIGIAADPPAFAFGYHGFATLGVWAAALVASLAGLGAVSGRIATPGRVGSGAVALGIGAVDARWPLHCSVSSRAPTGHLPLVAAFAGAVGGCTYCARAPPRRQPHRRRRSAGRHVGARLGAAWSPASTASRRRRHHRADQLAQRQRARR
jgi:hypothetical protein